MGDGYGYRCGERQFAGALLGQRIDSSGDTGFPWNRDDADVEQGIALANTFAKMEQLFLPSCFAPEALNESCVFMLPPMHRFGWYYVQAFKALGSGDAAEYVHHLREGLAACECVKDMAEFLMNHTPGLKNPSDELKAMAEQVRDVLSRFSPDDPIVTALKESEAYQKVSYFIEGVSPPIVGGLTQ